MILAEMEISNFKRFVGSQVFRPTAQGVIGVSGDNGAGKTTLFEAIEWCLYGSKAHKDDSIRPYEEAGEPHVRILFRRTRDEDGIVVERWLRGNKQEAIVYPEDSPEQPLARKLTEVNLFIERKLIGLTHKAFEATLFTRQKELGFFTNMPETARRTAVGKLLGLEAIRQSEVAISKQGKDQQAKADLRWKQLEDESGEYDPDLELERIRQDLEELGTQRLDQEARRAAIAVSMAAEQARWNDLNTLSQDHQKHQLRLTTLRGQIKAEGDVKSADQERIRLFELRRPELAADRNLAATIPALQQAVLEHQRAADLVRRYDGLIKARQTIDNQWLNAEREVTAVLAGWPTDSAERRSWSIPPRSHFATALGEFIVVAAGVDVAGAEKRLELMEKTAHQKDHLENAEAELARFKEHLQQLESERDQLLAKGDPAMGIAAAHAEMSKADTALAREQSLIERNSAAADRLAKIVLNLQSGEGERCPTCGRPFEGEDRQLMISTFGEQIGSLKVEIEAAREQVRQQELARQQAIQTERDESAGANRLQNLAGRMEVGVTTISNQQITIEQSASALARELKELGSPVPPDKVELAEQRTKLEQLQTVQKSASSLAAWKNQIETLTQQSAETEAELEALGQPVYDAEAHQTARASLAAANEAEGRAVEIERQLQQIPVLEKAVQERAASIATLEAQATETEMQMTKLGFDSAALQLAFDAVNRTQEMLRGQDEAIGQTNQRIADRERDRASVERFRDQMAKLREEASRIGKEAEVLEQVAKAMGRFDKYVAQRVTPELANVTSELLTDVTEGKYTEVQFDESYGITVRNDLEQFHPLSSFSGGEQDVIALSARLALSHYIGGQSADPPRFVVLDEVFGSLDQQRRRNVLEMLTALVTQHGDFQQIFVVSHVDDVRLANNLDQNFKVREVDATRSQVEQLTSITQVDEL